MTAVRSPVQSLRVIRLPNGRLVGLGRYVAAWKALLGMGPDEPVKGFDHFTMTAAEVLAAMREGLADRINQHARGYGLGRKWSSDWQRAAYLTAHEVNTPRLIVRWAPVDLRARLAHRIEGVAL